MNLSTEQQVSVPRPQPETRPEYLEEADEGLNLFEIFDTVWRRRYLFSLIVILITVAGLLYVMQLEKRYTASSSLMIGLPESNVVDIQSVLSGQFVGENAINSEIEVLRSRQLIKKLVAKLNLTVMPEFNPALRPPDPWAFLKPWNNFELPRSWKQGLGMDVEVEEGPPPPPEELFERQVARATNIALRNLSIRPINRSNVVAIEFESTNPALAARIANELPELYIIDQLEAKFEATEKAAKWLDERLTDLRQKVAESERAVEIYREQHGLTQAGDTDIVDSQLSEVSSQLIVARAERAQIEARYERVRQLLNRSDINLESVPDIASSPVIQNLRDQEITAQRNHSELSVEYGPKHPRMLQAEAELEDIRRRIDSEINKVVGALESEIDVARSRERSLQQSLSELETQSNVQNQSAIELKALEREASANRALFETFLGRFKETTSTQDIQSADARVISMAEVPGSPSYPKRKQMAILVLFAATGAGLGVVFLLKALHSGFLNPEQVEEHLRVPVIGLIPKVSANEPQDYILKKPHSGYSEALNSLKTSLLLSNPDQPVKVIQITSAVPEEGKTTLAISMARILARAGSRVALIDGDLRRSGVEKKLGLKSKEQGGLTDFVLSGDENLGSHMAVDTRGGVEVLLKGSAKYFNATDVLSSHRMETIFETMRGAYDYVIVDSPPTMVVTDSRVIGKLVDATVFVVRWDKTPKKVIAAALKQLTSVGVHVAGVVLQQVDLKQYSGYGYGKSGYYYHYGRYGRYYSN